MRIPKRLAGVAVAALAGSLALAACGDDNGGGGVATPTLEDCDENPNDCNSGPRADGGEIIWMINQGHDGVYNHLRPEGGSVYLIQMMAGLDDGLQIGYFTPDGQWNWNLDLLEGPAELVSEDPMTVVYQFREEAVWNDSTPIDIDDVLWHWYHNSNKEEHCVGCNPRATTFHDTTASIEGTDGGKTVTVTYDDGFASPEWFARGMLSYPAHIAEAEVGDWQNDPEAMGESSEYFLNTAPTWSAGPYVVESWTADEQQILVPSDAWFGETQATLDRLIKLIISDQPSWVPAMQNQEIHGGSPASFTPDGLERMTQVPGALTATGSAGAVWEHVDVNMDSITDQALRAAIFTAIDREDARTRIYGDLEPPLRNNHIFAQLSPYYEDHLSATGYATGDADAARAILEAAGYTGAESGGTLTDPEGNEVPELRFGFLQGNENRATFTELAQSYLADIGLTVVPDPIPGDQLGTVLTTQDYDLVIFGWSGSPLFANASYQFYHSTSGSNFGKLNNAQIDELVDQVRNQLDIDVSAELVNQVVPQVLEEAYVLPLWDTLNFMFVSDQYINIRDNHSSSLRSLYNPADWGAAALAE
jgi:peptide/nickel transport system substrate-binding protein